MKNKLVMKLLTMGLVAMIGLAPMTAYAATPIYHSHTGSEESGTGCYSKTIYHKHTGSENANGGCYTVANYHSHEGDSASGSGCYSVANYHSHSGSETSGGGCYTVPNYHSHKGNTTSGGDCYKTPVYHKHTGDSVNGGGCYTVAKTRTEYKTCNDSIKHIWDGDESYTTCPYCGKPGYKAKYTYHKFCPTTGQTYGAIGWQNMYTCCLKDVRTGQQNYSYSHQVPYEVTYYELGCGKNETTVVGYSLSCPKTTSTVDSYSLGCGKTTSTVEDYSLGCGKTETTIENYSLGCGKVTTTIEGYALGCGKTTSTIEGYKEDTAQGNSGATTTPSEDTGSSSESEKNETTTTDTTKEQGTADTTELDERDVVGNKSFADITNLVSKDGVNASAGNDGISGDELNKNSMNAVEPAVAAGLALSPGMLIGGGALTGGLAAGLWVLFGIFGTSSATLIVTTSKGTEEKKIKVKSKKNYFITKIPDKVIEDAASVSLRLEPEFIEKNAGSPLKVIIADTENTTVVSDSIKFDLS